MRIRRVTRILLVTMLSLVLFVGAVMGQNATPFENGEQTTTQIGNVKTGGSPAESSAAAAATTIVADTGPYLMAVMSDLHISSENLDACRRAVDLVNDLADISAVALLGDLVETVGSPKQYALAANLVKRFKTSVLAIPGNHDFLYADELAKDGKKKRGTETGKALKLQQFRTTFGQKALRFSRTEAGHLLVFLPVDALDGKSITTLSETTLGYFAEVLKKHRSLPTVVFCHAPLEGSYDGEDTVMDAVHSTAQPASRIREVLHDNPQVFLWVAGHRHVKPSSPDFDSRVNKVDGVTVIHVPNVTPKKAWVLTLRLTPQETLVRTIDTENGKAMAKFDRRFNHPGAAAGQTTTSSTTSGVQSSPQQVAQPAPAPKTDSTLKATFEQWVAALEKFLRSLGDSFRKLFS